MAMLKSVLTLSKILLQGYMGINSHHLDKNWERVITCLACRPLSESHTGENIYLCLKSVLVDWEILDKVKAGLILRDNASNMESAFKSDAEWNIDRLESLGCLNHSLQLVIKDGLFVLPSVEDVIKKCRSLVGHANHSDKFYAEFYRQQEKHGIMSRKSLKQDVATRYVINLNT